MHMRINQLVYNAFSKTKKQPLKILQDCMPDGISQII
jgi:hypothetical protein